MTGSDGGTPPGSPPKRRAPPTPTTPTSAERIPRTPSSSERSPRTTRSEMAMPPPSTSRMTTRMSTRLSRNDSEVEMEVDPGSRRGSDIEMAGCSRQDVEMGSRRGSDVEMSGTSSDVEVEGHSSETTDSDRGTMDSDRGTTDSGRESDMDTVTPRRRLRAPIVPGPEEDMAVATPEATAPEVPPKDEEMMASTSSKSDAEMVTDAEEVAVALGETEPEWKTPIFWWSGPNMSPGSRYEEKPHLTSIIYGSWYKIYVWPGGKPKPAEVKALTQAMPPPPPPSGIKNPRYVHMPEGPQVVPQMGEDGEQAKDGGENPAKTEKEKEPLPHPGGLQPMKIPERLVFTPPTKLEAVLFSCKCVCDWDWDHLAPVKVYHSQDSCSVMACHMVNNEADVDPALDKTTCSCRATPLVDKFVILPINEEYLLFYQRYNHLEYTEDLQNDAFLLFKGLPSMVEVNHQLEGLHIKKREGKGTFFAKFA